MFIEGAVFETEASVATPCIDTDVPGYLILRPTVAATRLDQASGFAAELGQTLGWLEAAIIRTTAASRVYVLRFSEAEPALHFHLFPRTAALAAAYARVFGRLPGQVIGPELFEWARQTYHTPDAGSMSQATRDVAGAIRVYLRQLERENEV
jgi:hypothetical protein